MIRVGEDTGTLDKQLETAGELLRRARLQDQAVHGALRAGVIVIVGLIVGFVAIALVSAMYGIYNQVKVK